MASIVIFEDDTALALHWQQILEDENHQVQTCKTLSSAIARIEQINPDVVITDMMIKQGDKFIPEGGLTLISKVAMMPNCKAHIIAVSGFRPKPHLHVTALDLAKLSGVDVALYKPIGAIKLIEAVNQLLADSSPKSSPDA